MNGARRYFLYEFSSSMGADFLLNTPQHIVDHYAARARTDMASKRTIDDYLRLYQSSDDMFDAKKPLANIMGDNRSTYRERRRWHHDIHLAHTVFQCTLQYVLDQEVGEKRTLMYMQNLEFFLRKVLQIDTWMTTYRATGAMPSYLTRFVSGL